MLGVHKLQLVLARSFWWVVARAVAPVAVLGVLVVVQVLAGAGGGGGSH